MSQNHAATTIRSLIDKCDRLIAEMDADEADTAVFLGWLDEWIDAAKQRQQALKPLLDGP